MTQPAEKRRHSIEEYLRIEGDSTDKHEFHNGEILAMSGGSASHSLIIMNTGASLHARLRGKRCRAYDSNLRVRIAREERYVYPDVSVVCGPLSFDAADRKQGTILNPRLLVEVISPSTEAYDRGEKFSYYRQIESLQEYVLVSQDRPRVEVYRRLGDGTWNFAVHEKLEATASLKSIDVELPLAEVYAEVEFPPPQPPQAEPPQQ